MYFFLQNTIGYNEMFVRNYVKCLTSCISLRSIFNNYGNYDK